MKKQRKCLVRVELKCMENTKREWSMKSIPYLISFLPMSTSIEEGALSSDSQLRLLLLWLSMSVVIIRWGMPISSGQHHVIRSKISLSSAYAHTFTLQTSRNGATLPEEPLQQQERPLSTLAFTTPRNDFLKSRWRAKIPGTFICTYLCKMKHYFALRIPVCLCADRLHDTAWKCLTYPMCGFSIFLSSYLSCMFLPLYWPTPFTVSPDRATCVAQRRSLAIW